MNKTFTEILQEMCKRVDADFSTINFNEPEWYRKYTWTEKEQGEFKQWMMSYFMEDKKRLVGFAAFPTLAAGNTREMNNLVDEFIFNYGWKCIYE